MARTLVVGDIHGGLKALKQLIDRIQISTSDHLIFLGDYVDGWSESAQVIDFLIALSRKQTCTFIRGNHDDLTYQWLKGGPFNETWMRHGGQSTIDSYQGFSDQEIQIHIDFYESLENYYIDAEQNMFVHAGFQNQNGPEYEYHDTAFYWDRSLWEMVCAMNKILTPESDYYPKRLKLFNSIYIGHTPTTRIGKSIPTQMANVWNIDTGAAFKGALSALDIHSKKFWQSDPVYTLYPDEKGRN